MALGGALILAFYKGTDMQSSHDAPIHVRSNPAQQKWIKGSFLLAASCITWSMWAIMQVYICKTLLQLFIFNGFAFLLCLASMETRQCKLSVCKNVQLVGIYTEKISCSTISDCHDKLSGGSTISCLRLVHTTQTRSMVYQVRHQFLVHCLCCKHMNELHMIQI